MKNTNFWCSLLKTADTKNRSIYGVGCLKKPAKNEYFSCQSLKMAGTKNTQICTPMVSTKQEIEMVSHGLCVFSHKHRPILAIQWPKRQAVLPPTADGSLQWWEGAAGTVDLAEERP
jgi:hypothetical protein